VGVRTLYPKLPPGPHPDADEGSVASNQRARLYGATIELVAQRGYERSIVRELCALAGVSKRTLYERFPGGKQECFLATYDVVLRHARNEILGRDGRRLRELQRIPVAQRLGTLVELFAAQIVAHPKAARLVLFEAPELGSVTAGRVETTARLVERVVCWSLCEGPDTPGPRGVVVRRVMEQGGVLLRVRLRDGHLRGLASELVAVCRDCVEASERSGRRRGEPRWERVAHRPARSSRGRLVPVRIPVSEPVPVPAGPSGM
jgi:AcrR family transcriptional regulator